MQVRGTNPSLYDGSRKSVARTSVVRSPSIAKALARSAPKASGKASRGGRCK